MKQNKEKIAGTMGAEAKIESEKKAVAQTAKVESELDTRETGEGLPGHRMLADEATGPYACLSTLAPEITVRPRHDMIAEGQSVNEIEKDAVRPKSDMNAEKLA